MKWLAHPSPRPGQLEFAEIFLRSSTHRPHRAGFFRVISVVACSNLTTYCNLGSIRFSVEYQTSTQLLIIACCWLRFILCCSSCRLRAPDMAPCAPCTSIEVCVPFEQNLIHQSSTAVFLVVQMIVSRRVSEVSAAIHAYGCLSPFAAEFTDC